MWLTDKLRYEVSRRTTRHYFSISAIFFTEIFSPPVRWVAVAHPLLMRRRATRAWASCSPDLERALSFLCNATWLRDMRSAYRESAPAALLPHLPPPPPPSLFRGQEPTTAPASAASPPSPFQLSTRPQNRAQNKISPNLPSLATSRPLTHLVFASYRNVADRIVPGTVVHASLTL